MSKYKHIFFDLDHTLWDHDKNSKESLESLYVEFDFNSLGVNMNDFIERYIVINRKFWRKYRQYKIKKEKLRVARFMNTLSSLNVKADFDFEFMASRYLDLMAAKNHLFPFAEDLLKYLTPQYELHIITNGFHEVQYRKLTNAGILGYFKEVIISEEVGKHKPHPRVFNYALEKCTATKSESLMIGDNLEADILGAKSFGMDQVYFNPDGKSHSEEITFEIRNLVELRSIL